MDERNEITKINWWKIVGILILILSFVGIGFFIGRGHTKVVEKEVVKYVELPPIIDSIPAPYPVYEKVDTANLIKQIVAKGLYSELFPDKEKTDTVYLTPKDTAKIVQDWLTKRDYTAKLFDIDTFGTCTINTSVQFNRLGSIDYTFNPVQKQTTQYISVKRKFIPFVAVGGTSFPSAGIEAGMLFKENWGIAITGNYYIYNRLGEYQPKVVISLNKEINGDTGLKTVSLPRMDFGFKVVKMF